MQMAAWIDGQLVTGALVVLAASFLLQIILIIIKRRRGAGDGGREFPRGPPAWPIIGHLPLLRTAPHRVLADLSSKHGYGPIMGLRLGSQPAVVVSSVALAKDLLLTHDKTFANRPPYKFTDTLYYGYNTAVIFTSYNPRWTQLRKIYTLELFTAKRLQQLQHIRQDELRGLLRALHQASRDGTQTVDVGRLVADMTFNVAARLLHSKTLSEMAPELPDLIRRIEHEGVPMVGDFIPWLKCLDLLQTRSMKQLHNRIDKIIDSIVQERRQLMTKSPPHELPHDFLQVILSRDTTHEDDEKHLTTREIKAILLDIFVGGISTSVTTLEWAMTELLRNPTCLYRLRNEIDAVGGKGGNLVNDEDISKMPYLENVVKEVFRLHPAAPLLVPRISSKACQVDKYMLPKNTQAFVNTWAIARDPLVWDEPEVFCPDRFKDKDMDVRGQAYELLPFGSGRRVCPGMRLGLSMVQGTLANLVKAFDWELPDGQNPLCIDMSEKRGLGGSKIYPIVAIPKARLQS